jgi:ATP-binding cassette, subfamily B, bacterial CvaB/MchF/RaxB
MLSEFQLQRTESHEAGLSAIAAASWIVGDRSGLSALRARFSLPPQELSLPQIMDILAAIGLTGRAVACTADDLTDISGPAILTWSDSTYVTLRWAKNSKARIFHPDRGWLKIKRKELEACFLGTCIEISRTATFKRKREPVPLNVMSLFHWSPAIAGGLVNVLVLSLVLQAYLLLGPLYMRIITDEVILRSDVQLLDTVALAFLLLAVFNGGATLLRGVTSQSTSAILNWEMTRRVFNHMIRLPLEWFQRRRLADAFVRFQALDPLRALISNGLITVLIDGVLSIAVIVALSILSPMLAVVTGAAVLLFTVIRFASVPISLRFSAQALTASIAEQGKRLETLRAIQTIKAMAGEGDREDDWASKLGDSVRASNSASFVQVAMQSIHTLFVGVTSVLVVYAGAREVLAGRLSIGTLLACIAYQAQIVQRVASFLDIYVQWRLLDMWNVRIADVVLTPTESASPSFELDNVTPIRGRISFSKVAYRYSPLEPFVLRGADLDVAAGEYVALVGPSGSGKSTLMKLICGLYRASSGDVLIDGKPLSHWGLKRVRSSVGVVLQDDTLLSGSIAENVASFDRQIDRHRVLACLADVGLEGEVSNMPLGVDTQIADIGSSLSGGQVQRVQLARALYRSPPILLLDEATAHLDPKSEERVVAVLKAYKGTRIVIAHSSSAIDGADRVVRIEDGLIRSGQRPVHAVQGFL